MKFVCENCGNVFETYIMDWKDLANVKCPYCGSNCVRRLSWHKILETGKWIKDPKPSMGKFVKPLPRKKAFEGC